MASSSNPPLEASTRIQDLEYLYASNVNVSNFVSVKLSGKENYHLWKTQMLCLMETHDMRGLVDDAFDGPRASNMKIKKQYDSLLKGWIFGSISEGVLGTVVDLKSAKNIWDKLKYIYVPSMRFRQEIDSAKDVWDELTYFSNSTMRVQLDSAQTKPQVKEETIDEDTISAEMETKREDTVTISVVNPPAEAETATEKPKKDRNERNKRLLEVIMKGRWWDVEDILEEEQKDLGDVMRDAIDGDKNTLLHLAVALSSDFLVDVLLDRILVGQEKEVLEMKNVDGSTALHIAAMVGNKYAAELLVQKHDELLRIRDNAEKDPLDVAYSNMQFETFMYLLQVANECKTKEANSQDHDDRMRMHDDGKTEQENYQDPDDRMNDDGESKQAQKIPQDLDAHLTELGVNVLVNLISAKEYGTASKLLEKFPKLAYANDQVLMAIARTFPSGLNHWETLIYPSLDDTLERVNKRAGRLRDVYQEYFCDELLHCYDAETVLILPLVILYTLYQLIYLLILMVHFPFFMAYYFMWKIATKLVEPIKNIDKKLKEWEEAKKVLVEVCEKIGDDHLHLYEQPILEAACRNVYQVVDEFLVRSPKAIQSEDKKSGNDIIQLAIIHRSEKIYNLLYQIPMLKSRYRTFKNSSGNNMLHVAGRLAPSYELKRRTGAALQLQRELQWFEELKTLVFPAYITEENIYNETPEMVFTREHENLVKEGEKWMKTTAESCSITAALITTIVFAAAITVPGGNNQETGTPLFTSDAAFIVFAASDAISLFTSTTSLLVFLSILTARFAEEDFLVRLPRRLIIGLCSLFISATAMMVAFSATLFLVFCDKKLWMLGPICGLACFPILLFVNLQFPLIVDLVRWTYVPIFGNRYQSRFDADEVQAYFANSRQGKLKQKLMGKEKAVTKTEAIKGGGVPASIFPENV